MDEAQELGRKYLIDNLTWLEEGVRENMSMERKLGASYLSERFAALTEHDLMGASEWLDDMDPDFEVFGEDVEGDGPEFREFWAGYDEALRTLTEGKQ